MFSSVPKAADFDRVYETGTPLKAPRMMPNFRELKHALKMPQFDLKTIYGTDVNLSDYKGKVIVLNVWATWCRPCVAEIPELITAQKALKNSDVRVLVYPFAQQVHTHARADSCDIKCAEHTDDTLERV